MSLRSIVGRVSPRTAAAGLGALLLLVGLTLLGGGGRDLARALATLPAAHPLPLCLGCGMFVVSLLCSAGAWRTAVGACGGRLDMDDAAADYGVGSLASSLLPARAGDGVRVALFARSLPQGRRLLTMSGILLALGVARAAVLIALVAVAAAIGLLPWWPLAALGGILAAGVAVAARVRRSRPQSRVDHVLEAFRALGQTPGTAGALALWSAGSIAARFAAAGAAAAAFGAGSPILAALVVVPALELAGLLPLTPGNLGIADGAVAFAMHASGAGLTAALTIGIGVHAIETLAGVGFGSWSLLYLTRPWRRFGTVPARAEGGWRWEGSKPPTRR